MTPRLALSLLFFFALTACGPPWKVIRQSGPPSALAGQQLIGVSFDWSRALLGGQPEAQWLATQPPEDQQSYMEVRNAVMQTYVNELASQLAGRGITVVAATGQEPIQLIVQPLMLEMGFYRFMVNMDSRLDSALVFTLGGQETDHIEVHTTAESNMANAQIIGRLSQCALRTARLTAEFIRRAQAQ